MRLTFVGADHEVTGSCHFLEAAGKNILVDYGMEQGQDTFVNKPLPVHPSKIDMVFLTHAHIDHSGYLPTLVINGFSGNVYTTEATADLCDIMLRDSAGIQEFEAEWRTRKAKRQGKAAYEPLYTTEDAEALVKRIVPCPYGKILDIAPGIKARFTDVGHLLGSAAVELWAQEDGREVKLAFSGDIGNTNQPLLKDPECVEQADYVIMESTYGDRSHGERPDYVKAFSEVIQRTFDRGGNVVVPSFAVGRTQEMLYFIRQIKEEGLIKGHDGFEVYVDSPLAIRATGIFNEHTKECFDEEATELLAKGINPIQFPGLRLAVTSDESKAINFDKKPKVIISASGMCEAGRIKHHLKHNLWRQESTILFVGYQAVGTLGRKLIEGADTVKIFNEEINVAAEICQLAGVSGHADREGLIAWASGFKQAPKRCFIVHGDDSVVDGFAALVSEKLGWKTMAPYSGTVYDLLADKAEVITEGEPIVKKASEGGTASNSAAKKASSDAHKRLLGNANRLLALAEKSGRMSNKDLAAFADQIAALIGKWED